MPHLEIIKLMPSNPYSPNSPYATAQAFSSLGPSLDNIVVSLAQQKYQIAKQREEMQFRREESIRDHFERQQQIDLSKKHTDATVTHLGNQDKVLLGKIAETDRIAQLGPQLGNVLSMLSQNQATPSGIRDDTQLNANLANVLGQAAMAGKRFAPQNAAQVMEMQDPRMRALIATGARPIQSVASQSATVDPSSGLINEIMPQKLNRGQDLVPGVGGPAMASGQAYPPAQPIDPIQKQQATLNNMIKANMDPLGGYVGGEAGSNIVTQAQQQLQSLLSNAAQATSQVGTNRATRAGLTNEAAPAKAKFKFIPGKGLVPIQ